MTGTKSPPRVRNSVARHGAAHHPGDDWGSRASTELWIMDEINAEGGEWGTSAREFVAGLKLAKGGPVRLILNSPGGDLWDALMIYESLRQHPGHVDVHIDGLAASAASVIAMAGDRIHIAPGSMIMVHDALCMAYGNEREHLDVAAMLSKVSNTLAEIYAARTGGTPASWRAAMRKESWYTAREAVNAGLADRISEPAQLGNLAKVHRMIARNDTRHRAPLEVTVTGLMQNALLPPLPSGPKWRAGWNPPVRSGGKTIRPGYYTPMPSAMDDLRMLRAAQR